MQIGAILLVSLNLTTLASAEPFSGLLPGEVPPDCSRDAGHLPDAGRAPGSKHPDVPVDTIFILMQENHSFDNVLGRLNERGYSHAEVDGLRPEMSNFDPDTGKDIHPFHFNSYCIKDTPHEWDESHAQWNFGKNDGFVSEASGKGTGDRAMGFYDETDLPYYYALANEFAIGDRYFSSVLGPTQVNRFFTLMGTSKGYTHNDLKLLFKQAGRYTLFERLNELGISWTYYSVDLPELGFFPKTMWKNLTRIRPVALLKHDLKKKKMPKIVFIDPSYALSDEHPPKNIQLGQWYVANQLKKIMNSRHWKKSVTFVMYDEHGGYFDHVPPPPACEPDSNLPRDGSEWRFDRLGFRVPLFVVSPYVKRHFVSHTTFDHTSLLKFIETVHNVPALTRRDANANDMMDFFDWQNPNFSVPTLPKAKVSAKKLFMCLSPKNRTSYRPPAGMELN